MGLTSALTPDFSGRSSDLLDGLGSSFKNAIYGAFEPLYEAAKTGFGKFWTRGKNLAGSLAKVISSVAPTKRGRNLFKGEIAGALSSGKK